MEELQYPIGRYERPAAFTPAARATCIAEIAATPRALSEAVEGLTAVQLDTPYRPGGWTVRQVVHHLADSHLNAYVRTRLALTEEAPTIRPYDEKRWAELDDARSGPVGASLALLSALHERWVALLASLDESALQRLFHHPEFPDPVSINELVPMYAWHGKHHVAHITSLREREGWG
jgi:hypothetical protein